jgi:hypothetical protein
VAWALMAAGVIGATVIVVFTMVVLPLESVTVTGGSVWEVSPFMETAALAPPGGGGVGGAAWTGEVRVAANVMLAIPVIRELIIRRRMVILVSVTD